MRDFICTTVLALFVPFLLFAQVEVSGVIVDLENGEPLIGVSIMDINKQTGTTSDFDGTFSLKVDALESGSAIQTSLVCLSAIRVCAFSSGSFWNRFVGKLLQIWSRLNQAR